MLGIYFAHFVSLFLYGGVIVLGLLNIRKTEVIPSPFRKFFIWYIVFAILTCFFFIGLQLDWIFNDHNKAVGDATALYWLLFDFLNVLSYLSGMVVLGIVLDLYKLYNEKMEKYLRDIDEMCSSCRKYNIQSPNIIKKVVNEIEEGIL